MTLDKTHSGGKPLETVTRGDGELECPAEFRDTEFRRNFAEFFSRNCAGIKVLNTAIRNSVCYGIPHFCGIPRNTEFRIFTEFRIITEFRLLYIYL